MSYTLSNLNKIIQNSCLELIEQQPMLFNIEDNVNERTVSGELAGFMRQHFKGYHVNCEYNRMTDEFGTQIPKRIGLNPHHSRVYPDIIVHRQEDREHNLLIIEIKMSWKNDNKEADFHKLTQYMKELAYQYGLYLELGPKGIVKMKWYNN